MKNKVILFLSLLALFVVPVISAADTKITVSTLPNHDVDISVLRHGQIYSLIESFHKNSGSGGNISITTSTSEATFDIRVWVKKGNVIIKYEKFETGFPVGVPINLDVFPDWYVKKKEIEKSMNSEDEVSETSEIENLTGQETTNVSEKKTEKNPAVSENSSNDDSGGITGFFTSIKEKISIKMVAYAFGFIFAIALFTGGFMMLKRRKISFYQPAEIKQVKIRKLSDKIKEKEEKKEQEKKENDEIAEAESKIKELQEKIQQIKNKPQMSEKEKRIAAAKKKLLEDEKELMKLRSEKKDSDDEEN